MCMGVYSFIKLLNIVLTLGSLMGLTSKGLKNVNVGGNLFTIYSHVDFKHYLVLYLLRVLGFYVRSS